MSYDLIFVIAVAALAWWLNKEPPAPRNRDEWRQR
jgi:hypothetical protein